MKKRTKAHSLDEKKRKFIKRPLHYAVCGNEKVRNMKRRVKSHSVLVVEQERRKFIKRNKLHAVCEFCEYRYYCYKVGRSLKERISFGEPYTGWCNSYKKDHKRFPVIPNNTEIYKFLRMSGIEVEDDKRRSNKKH